MREKDKTRSLSFAALIFVLIIIIGLAFTRKPDHVFTLTPQQTITAIQSAGMEISPAEAIKSAKANDKKYVFVDLRSPYDFEMGNIPGSVNIPANRILEKESLEFFDETVGQPATVVLYHASQSAATGPWMLLLQMGYSHIKIMQGGWDFYAGADVQNPSQSPALLNESAKYDFAAISASNNKNISSSSPTIEKETILPQRKAKTKKVEGGC